MSELDILLAPGVFPPDSGGPATFAPDIGRSLVRRGHTLRVVTNGTAADGFDEKYPFEVVRIPREGKTLRRYVRQIRRLASEIRDFDPDVVFANAFDLQSVMASRITRTPIVTKIVGDYAWERARRYGLEDDIETFQTRRYGPKIEIFRLVRTLQTRGAQHVVVPSGYLQGLVESWGVPSKNTSVIYNSLDLDPQFVPDSDRDNRIVTVGRLVSWKGIDGIIDAFAQLRANAELHIIGDGPEREMLEACAANSGCDDQIVFHGQVSHNRVLELVAHSRVFALNSTYEGLPHVVLEAMACGTPVVASAAGGTPEAVIEDETGYLVEPGNVSALADRFERLLSDREIRATFREGGFKMLDDRFSHDKMVEEYEQLLATIATR